LNTDSLIKMTNLSSGRKVLVAMIEPVGGHGGMDYYDFGLCSGLAKVGVDVVLYTCDQTEIKSGMPFRVEYTYHHIYKKISLLRRGASYIRGTVLSLFIAVLQARKIVHFHFFHVGILELMNIALAKLLFRKIVITAHDVESFVSGIEIAFMSRLAYKMADRVIAHNKIISNELFSCLGVQKNKICLIPHGNYLHMLEVMPSVSDARKSLFIPQNSKVLLFFGQIKEVKGLELLLKAMPFILKMHPETILIVAGKTWKTDFSKYQNIIQDLKIEKACITEISFIPNEKLPSYFAASDLLVLPYKKIYQSGVVLMAMSYKKAVLTSDIPGMLEVVKDNETGFLFRSEDVDDMAKKIINIFNNMGDIKRVEDNAFELMTREYDWALIGEQTRNLYEQLNS